MRIRTALLASLLPLILLTGCQTGDIKAVVPTAGGNQLTVLLGPNGPQPGEGDGYRVTAGSMMPAKDKREVLYEFGLKASVTPDLKRIQVEDISDDPIVTLVDDHQPEFKNGEWKTKTETISADDPRMQWMAQVPTSFRAYRFTLTHADGHQTVFTHVAMYSQLLKAVIRSNWGEKY